MKKMLMLLVAALSLSTSLTLSAADKPALTDEQKKAQKELTDKYDTDKNGKLNKAEKDKMTDEDKKKWADAIKKPKA